MIRSRLLAAAVEVCAAVLAASSAPAQEPFYKGKRLTLLVNFDAGSSDRHRCAHIRAAFRQAYRRRSRN